MTLLEVNIFMVFVKKGVGKFTHTMSVTLIMFCGAGVKRKVTDPGGEEGDKSEGGIRRLSDLWPSERIIPSSTGSFSLFASRFSLTLLLQS